MGGEQTERILLDISYPYREDMAIYPDNPSFQMKRVSEIGSGGGCNVSRLTMGTHTGTHIDAPLHFLAGGGSVADIPLEQMNGPAKVIEIVDRLSIGVPELERHAIEAGDIVLFKTCNQDAYAGDCVLQEYVTLDYQAAEFLAGKKVKLVGIDYMTIERPRNSRRNGKSIHRTLMEGGILILESIDLRKAVPGEYRLLCLPLKLEGGDGSPVRAVLEKIL